MAIDLRFDGKHVVVFGGTTGINFGVADAFAAKGARVTVVSRGAANVQRAVTELEAHGHGAAGYQADVRNFDAVGLALASAVAGSGPIDVLVSGAAGNFLCEAKDMSANGFRTVVDIDLVGAFHVARQAHARLRKPGSSLIHITAPQSTIAMRYQAHACAAKAGLDQLTRVLALEWGPEGIRVNAISPGPIEGTEGVKRLIASTDEQRSAAVASVPLGRLGLPEDIANLALFLASPHASYISGAVIPCDGGGAIDSVKPGLEAAGRAAPRP
jgi:NAD(P)-dependent dehydrogenase (short-subunit alcohol dehydrogenase family)